MKFGLKNVQFLARFDAQTGCLCRVLVVFVLPLKRMTWNAALKTLTKRKEAVLGIPAYVYIVANEERNLLYVGMTTDLVKRIADHRDKKVRNFTAQFKITRLVYFELYPSISGAMKREQQIKSWALERQQSLVEKDNPCWGDLWEGLERALLSVGFYDDQEHVR